MKNLFYPFLILINFISCSQAQDNSTKENINSAFTKTEQERVETFDNKTAVQIYEIANKFYDNETNDKAVIAFQKCIDLNYKKDTCYYKQGISYIGLNQTAIGIEKLEEALKINPEYFKACYNMGVVCYDTQNYLKSIEYYQKAEKLNPKDDRIYYGIACSQFALGQIKDAKINCQKALQLNPNNNDAKTLSNRIDKS